MDEQLKPQKSTNERVRDSYNKKFSLDQLRSLAKLENAARGIYNDIKVELSGLGVKVEKMRGDPQLGLYHYWRPKERATIPDEISEGKISKEHESRAEELFAKMDALERTGLIPNKTRDDSAPDVNVVTTEIVPTKIQRLARFLRLTNASGSESYTQRRFDPRPSHAFKHTQNEDIVARELVSTHPDDKVLLEITRQIEERAGETFKDALDPASTAGESNVT